MRLVQLQHPKHGRKIALVEEPHLLFLQTFPSIYELAQEAILSNTKLTDAIEEDLSSDSLEYDPIYEGASDWKILPALDHPFDPQHCMLSGTGLTHKASADNRQQMHEAQDKSNLTDSMKMYLWGVDGGHPAEGEIGTQPEWFYKGNGSLLRAHGEPLLIPSYGNDGGEEPEIAGLYIVGPGGQPWRIGFATANEFSDHVMERKNYLYLAPSKLRTCSIGPEIHISASFEDLSGQVSIHRAGKVLWEKTIKSGEKNMAHSLANLEYHHFKYPSHRIPGQVHVHFFGADAFSFGENIDLSEGDIMQVSWQGMGRPLRNPLTLAKEKEAYLTIENLK